MSPGSTDDMPADLTFDVQHVRGRRRAFDAGWSDRFVFSDGRVVVSIGERATALRSGQLRELFASREFTRAETADILRLAAALLAREATSSAASAVVGIIDLAARRFTYVCAGMAPPFVRYHDGTVSILPVDAPSDDEDRPLAQTAVDLDGAAQIVLYTGGLVRAGDGTAQTGLNRLARVLDDNRLAHSPRPAAWLTRRMLGDSSDDDVTLVVMSFRSRPAPANGADLPAWKSAWFFEATAESTQAARRAFNAHLKAKSQRGAAVDLSVAELIFGELLGNVVRHAPGFVEVQLDCTRRVPVLHVLDNGPGFESRRRQERLPDDELSESGRGLFIISACAPSFSMRNREVGGTHATATLPFQV